MPRAIKAFLNLIIIFLALTIEIKADTEKEILNNHKEWLHEFKEWDKAPTEGNLIGEKKKDSDNDTLH